MLQIDFYDTFAMLIAFQCKKFCHNTIKDASGIFFNTKSFCQGTSTYASALLLSYLVVRDAWYWDKLLEWSSLVAQLIQEQQIPRSLDEGALMLAACMQLAISFSYAVGRNHQNNTNVYSDPMNLADNKRDKALDVLFLIGHMSQRCLDLINTDIGPSTSKEKQPASKLTLNTTLLWQLKLSYGWHCLREGRINQCLPLFTEALTETKVLRNGDFVKMVQDGIEHGIQVNRKIVLVHTWDSDWLLSDRDFLSKVHSRLPENVKRISQTPSDLCKVFPRLHIKRRNRGQIQSEIIDDDVLIQNAPANVLAETHAISEVRVINKAITSDSKVLFVKTLTGKTIICPLKGLHTAIDLKNMIQDREGIHIDQQCIIFKGKQLENERSLSNLMSMPSNITSVLGI